MQAFTIIELLVAMAILALILVVLLSLTSSTLEVNQKSRARSQSNGDLRGALDRMSADFSSAIRREDLQPSFVKNESPGLAGNDAFSFFASADGYQATNDPSGSRGISRISYRIRDGRLERGASAAGWDSDKSPWTFPQGLGANDGHYDVMAERVFRLELDFLMRDGSLRNTPAPADWDEVQAVVVTLATIDERSLQRLDTDLAGLALLFPDPPASGVSAGDRWSAQLEDPSLFPGGAPPAPPILQGLNVRQRVFQLDR